MPHAIRIHATGGPEVMQFEEVAVGEPGPGQARVRHTAIGVNFIDTYHRSGLYPLTLPSGLGNEAAGVVEAVGRGRRLGQARRSRGVRARGPLGAYSDRARRAGRPARASCPTASTIAPAAAMMLKGLTVQYLLRQTFRCKGGETILFHAAAGGVGLIACQWARALGVTMIGTVGSDEKAALAREHGCAHTIVYTRENFVERVKEITGGKGVPVVYDGVGKDTFPASLDCLAPRGMFVSFGNASGPVAAFDIGMLAQKGSLYATRPTLVNYATDRHSLNAMANELFGMVKAGKIKADVRQTFPLRDAAEAHRALQARQTTGSTLLLPSCRRPTPHANLAFASRAPHATRLHPRSRASSRVASLTSARAASMISDAVSPRGPMPCATSASAAAPCRQTPMRIASAASMPCASSAPRMPASTSPEPAVASAGLPLALMSNDPSGRATMLPAPFNTTCARSVLASSVAAPTRSA